MIINYYNQYDIDTNAVQEKIELIKKSQTENAIYLSHILMKALYFLFPKEKLEAKNLCEKNSFEEDKYDAIVYFANEDTASIQTNIPVIKITNKTVPNLKKIKKMISSYHHIAIGFCPDDIEFSKYYHTKMRIYFLNVLDALNKMTLEYLAQDVEKACTYLLLDTSRFLSPLPKEEGKISLKKMIKMYQMLVETVPDCALPDNQKMFYSSTELDTEKIAMLNEMSTLAELFAINNQEERISQIYDIMCDRFLEEAKALGYCLFENNRCITARYTDGFPNSSENGCCQNTYKDRNQNCRYLQEDHSCSICSISCRAFSCKYLQLRGIDHALYQYPLLDVTFGILKKAEIVHEFFTPKEKMMKKLL